MRELVRQGMRDGAFGLSTGLFYVPGIFTPTEEVIELAKVAGAMGGIHVSHMRNEAAGVLDSVRETIAIGEQGGLPTQVTHHKIIGVRNWGKSVDTLKLLAEARARGVDATIDQYPYTASTTSHQRAASALGARGRPRRTSSKRLQDPAQRAKIKATVVDNIRVRSRRRRPEERQRLVLRLGSVAGRQEPRRDHAAARPRADDRERRRDGDVTSSRRAARQGIFHAIDEKDLERIIACPLTMIASDGEVPIFGAGGPAPAQLRHVRARARPSTCATGAC